MMKILSALMPVCMLLLSGCNLAPDYQRPEMDIAQNWETSQSQSLESKWWERFHDETLNALVEEALKNNRNITQAMARVDQAQAGLGIARDALLPVLWPALPHLPLPGRAAVKIRIPSPELSPQVGRWTSGANTGMRQNLPVPR